MNLTLPIVTTAALIDSINPCAISVLLLTLAFLASLNKSKKQIFIIGIVYILGIFITYVLIGVGTIRALSFFGIPKILSKIGSLILILTGAIGLLKIYFPKLPFDLTIPHFIKPSLAKLVYRGSSPAAFLLGILVGLFEFPCTGGPYLLILSLLHDRSTSTNGVYYLLYYNFIFVLPLILTLILTNQVSLWNKIENWRKSNSSRSRLII
jgi:cytochrome c-type biogenesis protein